MKLYAIEPELLQPVPRRLADDASPRGSNRFFLFSSAYSLLVCSIPLFLGISWFLTLLWMAIAVNFGSPYTAIVLQATPQIRKDGKPVVSYRVRYVYTVKRNEYEHFQFLLINDLKATKNVNGRQTLQVLAAPVLSGFGERILLPHEIKTRRGSWFEWIVVVIWNGLWLNTLYGILRAPKIVRRILTEGPAAIGYITDKKIRDEKSGEVHEIHYEFEAVPFSPQQSFTQTTTNDNLVKSDLTLSKDEWETLQIGDYITVLFDEHNPKLNFLYRFSPLKIASVEEIK